MKIRVADLVAEILVKHGITTLFSVVGGGAMHLNDAFGHNHDIKCVYNHHEQACTIAAEGYYRVSNELPAVCVTTGPGGTNAISGVLGSYLDSIPMLVISGQVKYEMTVDSTGLPLRQLGDQEWNIISTIDTMTKYAVMITNPKKVKYCLEKAIYISTHGRPGPCWVDIPLNIQGAIVETDDLIEFDENELNVDGKNVTNDIIEDIIQKIQESKRPIIYAGSAIRTNKAYESFLKLIHKLNIPVVSAWNSIDVIEYSNELYVGVGGSLGTRAANFAVQNSDLLISLGCRLSTRQVSFSYDTWAREAYKIMVDIDDAELNKPTLNIDMPIQADIYEFINKFNEVLDKEYNKIQFNFDKWQKQCIQWKEKYLVCDESKYNQEEINIYAFLDSLSNILSEDSLIVVTNGSPAAAIHAYKLKKNSRLIVNSGAASMGYGLPAAIGSCFATEKQDLVCICGDGSIQMNIQELQTIVHHKLPIKLFIINNDGYQSIRITQNSFFEKPLVGIGSDSGDVSFPSIEKIAKAYGIPYFSCKKTSNLENTIKKTLDYDGYVICEVFVDKKQMFEPKSASKKLSDGTMISAPLEDMKPFLDKNELKENMYIDLVERDNV